MKRLGFCLLLGVVTIAGAQIDCVYPALKVPNACGVVTDPDGQPIRGAEVSTDAIETKPSTTTDGLGRWSLVLPAKSSGWVQVRVNGFQMGTLRIVTQKASSSVCKKPIYVRLVVGEGCTVATMKPKQGIKK